jgi:PAS domain S-box-containing protein
MAALFDAVQQQMLEAVDAAVLGLDADGVCRHANQAAYAMFAATETTDLIGRPVGDIVHWAARGDLPAWEDCFARAAESGQVRSDHEAIERGAEPPLSVEVTVRALRDGESIAGHLILLRDITDRSRQAKAFHASVKSFRALFDSLGDAIFFLTRQGKIIDSNQGVQRAYGISQQALVGKSIDNILAPGRHEIGFLSGLIGEVFSAGTRRVEFWSRGRERQEFPAEAVLYPADYFGQRVVMAVVHDISERKRHEAEILLARDQAEQASRMKSQFMRNMSHEFRTPLNGIIGMADLLTETDLGGELIEYVRTVQENGRNLLSIVNNLLDLARLESQQYQTAESEFFPPALLEGLSQRYAQACAAKGLALEVEVQDELNELFVGDETILAKILGNLLDNAVKFTPAGRILLSASLAEGNVPQGMMRVRFAVRDTGIGIGPDQRAHIFEAFVQGDGSATRQHGGAGLGLSIARYLVATLGGEMTLDSIVGQGSEFAFSILLKPDVS